MASNLKLADNIANAEATAVNTEVVSGYIRIYDGTQPATADDAIGSVNLLAELRFGNPAFGTPSAGVITANAIAPSTGLFTGTATWFRVLKSDGVTKCWDGNVGLAAATPDMVLNSVAIGIGATVTISSFTHTVTK
jgi:hypothetical protein